MKKIGGAGGGGGGGCVCVCGGGGGLDVCLFVFIPGSLLLWERLGGKFIPFGIPGSELSIVNFANFFFVSQKLLECYSTPLSALAILYSTVLATGPYQFSFLFLIHFPH